MFDPTCLCQRSERLGFLRTALAHPLIRLLAFPIAVVIGFGALVALNLNGSSTGVLAGSWAQANSSVVVGKNRPVRSDEYRYATPFQVGNVRAGFPVQPWIGLTPTNFMATTYNVPNNNWAELLKPSDWGYHLFGPSRGLAWTWWMALALPLLTLYWLLFLLTRSPLASAALAVAGTFTPYAAWWTTPSPGLVVGFVAGFAACSLAAIRARRVWPMVALSGAAGLSAAASFLVLYPPWTILGVWITGGLVGGQLLDRRIGWRRSAVVIGTASATAGAVLVPWYLQNRDAIKATADTIYPGQRISQSGEAKLPFLLDAPLNFWFALKNVTFTRTPDGIPLSNLSETSSTWLPLPIVLIAIGCALWIGWRRKPGQTFETAGDQQALEFGRWTVLLTAGTTALILAWAVLPLPSFVGKLTLLSHVSGSRAPMALGLGTILLVAMSYAAARNVRLPKQFWVLWIFAIAATGGLTAWSWSQLPTGNLGTVWTAAVSGLVCGLAFALVAIARWRIAGGVILACYCLASWVIVNPLVKGLGPLANDPIVTATQQVLKTDPQAKFVVLGESIKVNALEWIKVNALVQSSGAQSLSGVTFYPTKSVMESLLPGQEDIWNNYVIYRWQSDSEAQPAYARSDGLTRATLHINMCSPQVRALGITNIVSTTPLTDVSCLQSDAVVKGPGRETYWYRYS